MSSRLAQGLGAPHHTPSHVALLSCGPSSWPPCPSAMSPRLRSAASSKLAEVEAHKRAALAEAEQQQRTCEAELARLKGELRAALELMVSHRMWVQQRLEATLSAVNQVHAEVQQQPIPQLSL
mmetsp:Transcript_33183/g.73357  ORF Transcript_33183/g.73357 Transcript_33183/m.73357 type:complete len:123 (+) Transcript_33183:801-1169(+)